MDNFDLDTLDLDDLFADVEQEIAAIDNESDFDRFDRLRVEYEQAVAEIQSLSAEADRIAASVTTVNYRPHDHLITAWPEYVSRYDHDLDGAVKIAQRESLFDAVTWSPDYSVEQVRRVCESVERLARAQTARESAEEAYTTLRSQLSTRPEIGSYVSFRTKKGNDSVYACGTVDKYTKDCVIIRIDKHNSYLPYEQDTARIVVDRMTYGVWSGGRAVSLEWGPKGNLQRAEREAAKRAEQERQYEIADRAQQRMNAAWREYREAEARDTHRTNEIANIPALSLQAAQEQVLSKYAAEVEALRQYEADWRYAALGDYERPAILDKQPSSNWRDYVEEEEQ